ncbi:diguanylate cyclase domain-containing protein [Massilia sp.]|uniref:diguanylate cyclase domain-containing protein n=1 Tax=Massilia sp. TaxID=1882437 RepID=UPI0028B25D95|nr:diguanylate cyclase [Massilia sp.]
MPHQIDTSLRFVRAARAYFHGRVLLRLAVFLAVALPLTWLLIHRAQVELRTTAHEESNRNVQNLSHAFAEEVRSTVTSIDLSLSQLRLSWLRNPAEFGAIVAEMNTHLQGQLLVNVVVTDERGMAVFASAGKLAGPVDLSDREYVRAALNGKGRDDLAIGQPRKGRVTGTWTVQFSRPILRADGSLAGVIVAGVAPSYFSRFYDSIDLGTDASISLVRSNGIVVARTTRNQAVQDSGRVLTGAPYVPGSGPFGSFHRVSRLDGIERYYGWRTLPEYGLVVTVGQAVKDAQARYAVQRRLLRAIGGVVSLLLVLGGWIALAAWENRRRAVAALAAAEARWQLALNAAGEGVWDFSFASGMITLSPSAQGIVDASGVLLPFDRGVFRRMAHSDDVEGVLRGLDEHLQGATPHYAGQYRTRLGNGNWRWILVRGRVVERAPGGQPLRIVGTVADIDARKLQEDEIRHQAHHDMLTGLPNRLLFNDRLRQALLGAQREGNRLAVIFFDLDRFKPVNDTHGHAVGDLLLQQVATRVRGALRASDTLARIGGDEFVVLLPRIGAAPDARRVAEDILKELNRPFITEEHRLEISGSIGVAVYPDSGSNADELMRSADQAMYDAKLQGRACVAERTSA